MRHTQLARLGGTTTHQPLADWRPDACHGCAACILRCIPKHTDTQRDTQTDTEREGVPHRGREGASGAPLANSTRCTPHIWLLVGLMQSSHPTHTCHIATQPAHTQAHKGTPQCSRRPPPLCLRLRHPCSLWSSDWPAPCLPPGCTAPPFSPPPLLYPPACCCLQPQEWPSLAAGAMHPAHAA